MGEIIKYLQQLYFELFITDGNNADFVKCINDIEPGVFFTAFLYITLIPVFIMFLYYVVIDHPRAKGFMKWLILSTLVSIVSAFIVDGLMIEEFYYLYEEIYNDQITDVAAVYSYNFLILWFVNFMITLISCFVFSLLIKLKSKNCSKTPF